VIPILSLSLTDLVVLLFSLKSYGQHNNQMLQCDGNNRVHDNVWDVTKFLKEKEKDGLSAPSSKAYLTSF